MIEEEKEFSMGQTSWKRKVKIFKHPDKIMVTKNNDVLMYKYEVHNEGAENERRKLVSYTARLQNGQVFFITEVCA